MDAVILRRFAWPAVFLALQGGCSSRQAEPPVAPPIRHAATPTIQKVEYEVSSPEVSGIAKSLDQTATSTALPDLTEKPVPLQDFTTELPYGLKVGPYKEPLIPPASATGVTRTMNPDGSLNRSKELLKQTTPKQGIAVDAYWKY